MTDDERHEILTLLRDLMNGTCWCQFGIGNPMFTEHSQTCKRVCDFINRLPEIPATQTVNNQTNEGTKDNA